MVCAIIGDRDISPRLAARLEHEMTRLTGIHGHVHFLIGERCGFEQHALYIARRLCTENHFVSYNVVTYGESCRNNSVSPEAIEMIRSEYLPAWRDRWMLNQAETAILFMDQNPDTPARLRIIDLAKNQGTA